MTETLQSQVGGPTWSPIFTPHGLGDQVQLASFSAFPMRQANGTGTHTAQLSEALLLGLGKPGSCWGAGLEPGPA